jgi:hypothetical protein
MVQKPRPIIIPIDQTTTTPTSLQNNRPSHRGVCVLVCLPKVTGCIHTLYLYMQCNGLGWAASGYTSHKSRCSTSSVSVPWLAQYRQHLDDAGVGLGCVAVGVAYIHDWIGNGESHFS